MVIKTTQGNSKESEIMFCVGLNSARILLKVYNGVISWEL